MIKEGSKIVLQTRRAIYSTCEVLFVNKAAIRIRFCAGLKLDRETGEYQMVRPTETILAKDVVFMSERA